MPLPEFRTGDIVCFADRSFISRAIRVFTRSPFERRTKCSHVGMMINATEICEALSTVKIHDVTLRMQDGWRMVYRPIGLTNEHSIKIIEQCHYYRGKNYGWWKNIAHALDGLCGGLYLFRRLCRIDNYPICSWLVAWVFERCVGVRFFGCSPKEAQPDDIHDYILAHPDEFELIYERKE